MRTPPTLFTGHIQFTDGSGATGWVLQGPGPLKSYQVSYKGLVLGQDPHRTVPVHVDRIGEVPMRFDMVFFCCTGFVGLRSSSHGGRLHFGIGLVNFHCSKR